MRRGFPFGGPGPRMFERGYLKYALLELLKERPKHGYEMMKELEARMGGFYAPSAGAVYPTLQLLEDRGWVTSESAEGKKVYKITPEGTQALDEASTRRGPQFGEEGHEHHGHHEHHEHHEGPHGGPRGRFERGRGGPWDWSEPGRGGPGFGWRGQPEARELARQAREVGRLMLMAGMSSMGDPERMKKLRQIVERTRAEIDAFLREQPDESPRTSGSQQGETGPVEQV